MAKFTKTLTQGTPFEITGDAYFNTRMRRKVRIAWFVTSAVALLGTVVAVYLSDSTWQATLFGGVVAGGAVICFGIGIDRNDFTRYSFLLGGSSITYNSVKALGQFKGWW